MKLMKKFLSLCLAMIMTLSMLTVSVGAEEKEEPIVKILTLSDYQKWLPNYSGDDWSSLQTQLKGLVNGAYNAGVDPDYMIFGGDYSCMDSASLSSTGKSQVDSIIQSKWPHLKGDNMFVVQGNHDPAATDGLMETTAYETDDFIVYLLNEDIFPSKQGASDAKGIVSKAAADLEEWLLGKVDEEETRPIFICSHTGLHYDIDRTDGNNQYAYMIFDVINEAAKYLDVVFMFGHNHTNGDELVGGSITCFQKGDTLDVCTETSISNRSGMTSVLNFTYMNYGYIGYIGDITNNASPIENVTNILAISELSLYEDRIEVRRYSYDGLVDLYTRTVDRDYCGDTDFGDKYTLSYESNGGTDILSQKTTQSWNTVSRVTPVKNGADFLYWSTKEDGTGNRYQPGDSIYVSADTTLYAQFTGGAADGDSSVFELTEELKAGETYLLAWNSELYSNDGTRYALTNGSTNVTAMNASWVSADGAKLTIPSNVDTSVFQWVCGGKDGQYTFQNASTKKYLAYSNSALSFAASSSNACLWNIVLNTERTDDRAPAGMELSNLVPYSNSSAFIRYSVGGGQLKMGTKSTNTDTANSDVSIYKMTAAATQAGHKHSFGEYVSDKNATCFTDGTQSRSCTCGVVETIALKDSKVDHEYVYSEGLTITDRSHYIACTYCGDKQIEAHIGGTATVDKLAECEICGKEYGEYAKPEPTPTPTPGPTPDPLPYKDVTDADWFYDAVEYTFVEGLMTGLDDTHFGPYGQLSRAQFALMLHRMEDEVAVETDKSFGDITGGEWYGPAVLWAAENDIVTGYQNGNFGPADMITREQMAVMMYRYAKYLGQDVTVDADFDDFKDAASVSTFATDAMKWAVGNGIITGKDGGTILDPQGNTARSEAAVIIQRFLTK